MVRARIASEGGRGGTLEQVDWLTPYVAETIGQAAQRAGPRARLEVIVPKSTSADRIAAVEALFGWLAEKGVAVIVRVDESGR